MHSNDHDPLMNIFVAISLLFLMYFTLHSLCDLWCLRRSRSHHTRRNRRPTMFFFAATDPSAPASVTASRGLDPAVLRTLPVFAFSDVTHKDPIDCAVCLSEFEEGEAGRVLPGCKHAFHVECIDMWFHSHSTCPLCRSLVQPPATTLEEQIVIAISHEPVYATEPVTTSGPGSSAMTLEDVGREPAAIETPRRGLSDDVTQNLPAINHSFTSPMNRVFSFARMLSRNGRSAPPSFAGAPSQSSCRIVMNESDIERGGQEMK